LQAQQLLDPLAQVGAVGAGLIQVDPALRGVLLQGAHEDVALGHGQSSAGASASSA
jgi:hypothetical protein